MVFSRKAVSQQRLIETLNPVLTGWGNYYRYVVSKEVFSKMDHILNLQLRRWSYRRHKNKSNKWRKQKYFIQQGSRHWIFGFEYQENGKKRTFALKKMADIPIERYIKVKKDANPFDPNWNAYFEKRCKKNPHQYEHLINTAQPQSSAQFAPQQQPQPLQETQPIHRTEQHSEGSNIGSSIGSLFDMPILPNGDDPEEEMFRRRMQRKKKKGRRM